MTLWKHGIIFIFSYQLDITVHAMVYQKAAKTIVVEAKENNKNNVLVKGVVRVSDDRHSQFKTLHGVITGGSGEYWLEANGEKVIVKNISNKLLQLTLRDQRSFAIPEGYEIWIGKISTSGYNETGVPEPINMEKHLKIWSQMYVGSRESFVQQAKKLSLEWPEKIKKGQGIQANILNRYVATQGDKESEKRVQESKRKSEQTEFKKKWLKKVFQSELKE